MKNTYSANLAKGNAKNYLLDISTLIFSPYSILAFDDNNVIIPLSCVKELNRALDKTGDTRANARECSRLLASLAEQGSLSEGVRLDSGGQLRIIGDIDEDIFHIAEEHKRENYIIVSRNPNVRIIANQKGIHAEDYKSEQVSASNADFEGRCIVYVSQEEIASFKENKMLKLAPEKDYIFTRMDGQTLPSDYRLTVNEFVLLNGSTGNSTMLGRFDGTNIVPLRYMRQKNSAPVFGVTPRNVGQIFALEALLAPPSEAPLVILKGPAGTAKTFLSMAAGLERTMPSSAKEAATYRKILLTRPNAKMDEDVGFLKGDEVNKVLPALRGLTDNLDNLMPNQVRGKDGHQEGALHGFMDAGIIDAQAMAYMRGRSICHQFVIVDEVQNATVTQVLSMITRIGEGSKIVILGDPDQIDHPYLDRRNNGLSYAAERMRGSNACWQLTFSESECTRSELASEAIARLTPKGAQI